ncbi:MAG: imidazole glycerol phosphate synthase subunit HisF [Flavobacteriales bacterium]|nr:imidazole glycerol phosphate synthase subunit HisF [Flavobacteriales bacterium]
MFRPRVMPTLLLKEKGLVKTINFKDPTYVGDPINAVKIFNDSKADELVFLDISQSRANNFIDMDIIRDIAEEAFMPFAFGGGVQTLEHVSQIFNAGAEKVVINTAAFANPNLIREASNSYGSQAVICSIDARKNNSGGYEVFANNGAENVQMDPATAAKQMEENGAGEILITSIDEDGRQEGYDIELIKLVSEAVNIPVIASGGAGNFEHLNQAIQEGGASATAAASMFVFIGRKRAVLINYPDKEELEEIFSEL